MICSGLVLDGSTSLLAQRVANNSQILAIILSCDPDCQKVCYSDLVSLKHKTIIYKHSCKDGRKDYPRSRDD